MFRLLSLVLLVTQSPVFGAPPKFEEYSPWGVAAVLRDSDWGTSSSSPHKGWDGYHHLHLFMGPNSAIGLHFADNDLKHMRLVTGFRHDWQEENWRLKHMRPSFDDIYEFRLENPLEFRHCWQEKTWSRLAIWRPNVADDYELKVGTPLSKYKEDLRESEYGANFSRHGKIDLIEVLPNYVREASLQPKDRELHALHLFEPRALDVAFRFSFDGDTEVLGFLTSEDTVALVVINPLLHNFYHSGPVIFPGVKVSKVGENFTIRAKLNFRRMASMISHVQIAGMRDQFAKIETPPTLKFTFSFGPNQSAKLKVEAKLGARKQSFSTPEGECAQSLVDYSLNAESQ